MTTEATAVAAAQDAAAEAPQAPVAKAKAAAASRKPSAAQARKAKKAAEQRVAPTMREIEVDGEKVKVAIGLSDADAEKAARITLDAQRARSAGNPDASVPDTETPAPTSAPKGRVKSSVPSGSLKVRLSKTAYEQAFVGEDGKAWRAANKALWSRMKGSDPKTFGSTITYYVIVPTSDAKLIQQHLLATAKAWEKAGAKGRDRNSKPLTRNAQLVADQIKHGGK